MVAVEVGIPSLLMRLSVEAYSWVNVGNGRPRGDRSTMGIGGNF